MIIIPLGKKPLSQYHKNIIQAHFIFPGSTFEHRYSTLRWIYIYDKFDYDADHPNSYGIEIEDEYVKQEQIDIDNTIYRIKYNGITILQFDVTEKDGEYVVKITPEEPKPQPKVATVDVTKKESKEHASDEEEATQRQRTRHSSTQEDTALTTFKKDIVAILNKYSSTVQFTMFGHPLEFNYKFITCGNYGHHHEGRVRAVINAINHPDTTKDDVLTILRRQHDLMTKSDLQLNWNVHKDVSYEILAANWQDDSPKRKCITPESQKTSGFLKVITAAIAKAEPQPEAQQQSVMHSG